MGTYTIDFKFNRISDIHPADFARKFIIFTLAFIGLFDIYVCLIMLRLIYRYIKLWSFLLIVDKLGT